VICRIDHIGITVRSLEDAQAELEAFYPRYFGGPWIETGSALREVSVHQPSRFRISLHGRPDSIGIELIEYPRLATATSSIFPWYVSPEALPDDLPRLKSAVRSKIERGREAGTFSGVLSQLSAHPVFNAVVVSVEDPAADERFWKDIRFRRIVADDDVVVVGQSSLLPPFENRYVVLFKTDRTVPCYTDAEGINEIALLCASCRASLDAFRHDVFRSSVSAFSVNGNEVSLGYLRSPSKALVELMSVRRT